MDIEKLKRFLLENIVSVISIIVAVLSISILPIYILTHKCKPCEVCKDCKVELKETVINNEEKVAKETLKVDVKGSVKKPGVYELNIGSNVMDAIKLAGGVNSTGITSNINLSKKLSDEMVVYVFSKKELENKKTENKLVCEVPKCECEQIVIKNGIDEENDKPKEEIKKDSTEILPQNNKININNANIKDLMTLKGIGEAKAEKIIEYRTTKGPFKTIEEIKNVSGIGDKGFLEIKDMIIV